jgi:hypothetical protein
MLKNVIVIMLAFFGPCLGQTTPVVTSQEDLILSSDGSSGIVKLQALKTARANVLINSYNDLVGRDSEKANKSIDNFASQYSFKILIDVLEGVGNDRKVAIIKVLKQAPPVEIKANRESLLPALKQGTEIYAGGEQATIRDIYLRELLDIASKAYGISISKTGPNASILEHQASDLLEKISKKSK